ncbi:GNAT family N-acetyltransferase [Virgibacillus siamensis]|uniref:GNAT family N-acetyltransferase n=1 Tax=Virgibacillus siamensis TaxID=480071 RepID=UPI000984868D|nr:GNAT family N-acetyltransferase [Virgibacillus siamensis]
MYKIREIKQSDQNAINELVQNENNMHIHQVETPISEEDFTKILNGNTERLYVIEKDAAIRAFIQFQLDDDARKIEIKKLTVENSYIKKGLDEHLYSKVERLANRKGYENMHTELTTSNAVVCTFFDEKGWQRIQDSNEFYKGVNG